MYIGTWIKTWLFGHYVGQDVLGNRYYESRFAKDDGKKRRWVLYKGEIEASRVPPLWHGWLHYSTDAIPSEELVPYSWEKPHKANMTGTKQAYLPSGHVLKGGKHDPATGDYQPWQP